MPDDRAVVYLLELAIHLIPKWRPRARKRGDRGQILRNYYRFVLRRRRFFSKFSFFFDKRLFDSKANNSEPLQNMLIDICMSFDVLLGFYRKMYVVRNDDNKMAMSTVSSYEEIDYNRSLVLTAFPFQFLRRHCHEPDIHQSEIEKNNN